MKSKTNIKSRQKDLHGELLQSILDQILDGIAVVTPEGNINYVNSAFAKMHGYRPEELIGKNLSIFHTPEQMPAVKAANRKIRETGKFFGEIRHLRKDGTFFPSLMRNSLLRDKNGRPIGMIGTMRDISAIKKIENDLREERKRFQDVVRNAREWVWEVDAGGRYTYSSPAVTDILGYQPEEIIGKHFSDFFHPEDRPKLKRAASEIFSRKKPGS